MPKVKPSAGLLMYRDGAGGLEVFLVHPGGPLFRNKDAGYWGVPKGEIDVEGEDPLDVAHREFEEETGRTAEDCGASGEPVPLGTVRQRNGKIVHAWAFRGDWPEAAELHSNQFSMEWPPRSGRFGEFPEIDEGRFFPIEVAREKMNGAQAELIERLVAHLGIAG